MLVADRVVRQSLNCSRHDLSFHFPLIQLHAGGLKPAYYSGAVCSRRRTSAKGRIQAAEINPQFRRTEQRMQVPMRQICPDRLPEGRAKPVPSIPGGRTVF
jgi:hypothetical protein